MTERCCASHVQAGPERVTVEFGVLCSTFVLRCAKVDDGIDIIQGAEVRRDSIKRDFSEEVAALLVPSESEFGVALRNTYIRPGRLSQKVLESGAK